MDDPRYRVLAMRAAAVMGSTSKGIVNAIIAHMRCEIGSRDAYPPTRNNPGNVAQDAARDVKAAYTVDTPNPQPGNPIVTFSTPEYGADTYGHVINDLPRYAMVRSAVRADEPEAYLHAVAAAGYGTGFACLASVYRDPADSPPPASLGTPPPAGTSWWMETATLDTLYFVDAAGVLRPVKSTPANYAFTDWTSSRRLNRWSTTAHGLVQPQAYFRELLGPHYVGRWVKITADGVTWHPV